MIHLLDRVGVKRDVFKVPFLITHLERSGITNRVSEKTKRRCYMLASWLILYYFNVTWAIGIRTFGVVKGTLNPPCCRSINATQNYARNQSNCSCWEPFVGDHGTSLIGLLDTAVLVPFSIANLILGNFADHFNYRYILTIGGVSVTFLLTLFGLGYFLNIHIFAYFLVIQLFYGLSASVYSSTFAVIGIWFHGCRRKHVIISAWATYSGVGRILGGLLPAVWVDGPWGWAFVTNASLITIAAFLTFFLLVPYPESIGISTNKKVEGDGESEKTQKSEGIKFWRAFLVPGVIEYSITFFFNKSVYYTFLFWLPYLIRNTVIGGIQYQSSLSAVFSILFDIGSIFGVVTGGFIASKLSYSLVCTGYLYTSAVLLYVYSVVGSLHLAANLVCLFFIGATVNGTHALILSCVTIDLGKSKSIAKNTRAIATMNGIINFSGSVGAAITVSLIGVLFRFGTGVVLYSMIGATIISVLFLTRIALRDLSQIINDQRRKVYVIQ